MKSELTTNRAATGTPLLTPSRDRVCLFVEDLTGREATAPKRGSGALTLPAGPAWLITSAEAGPRLSPEPDASPAPLLEAVHAPALGARLLLLVHGPHGCRINGQRSPRLALLSERDQFTFGGDRAFHVGLFRNPRIGTTPPDLAGKPCCVCLSNFSAESRVFICPCGAAFHCDEDSANAAALQCAQAVSHCPACQRRLELARGFSWIPEFCHEPPALLD